MESLAPGCNSKNIVSVFQLKFNYYWLNEIIKGQSSEIIYADTVGIRVYLRAAGRFLHKNTDFCALVIDVI